MSKQSIFIYILMSCFPLFVYLIFIVVTIKTNFFYFWIMFSLAAVNAFLDRYFFYLHELPAISILVQRKLDKKFTKIRKPEIIVLNYHCLHFKFIYLRFNSETNLFSFYDCRYKHPSSYQLGPRLFRWNGKARVWLWL